jgi:hypothetical protein
MTDQNAKFEELRFAKKQQWTMTNYALLLLARSYICNWGRCETIFCVVEGRIFLRRDTCRRRVDVFDGSSATRRSSGTARARQE